MITKTEKTGTILEILTKLPIIDTEQVGRLVCSDCGSPSKRASELLLSLEEEKLIEGRRREIGKAKVWRLSKKGRDQFGITRQPVPLTGMKVDHLLAIGNVYLDLIAAGKVARWITEPREIMGKKKYCPDAFLVFQGKPFLLEVQLSPISSKRWAEKWAIASEFFDNNHYKEASFQFWKPKTIRPRIVVISSQETETIRAGTRLDPILLKSTKELARHL